MSRADFDRRMLALLTRADELAAGFLALDAELRALARDMFAAGTIDRLAQEAARRGMTTPQLADALLTTIASDGLFDAVLGAPASTFHTRFNRDD